MLIEVEVGEWLQSLDLRARQPAHQAGAQPHLHTHGKTELISKREKNGVIIHLSPRSRMGKGRASRAALREHPCS